LKRHHLRALALGVAGSAALQLALASGAQANVQLGAYVQNSSQSMFTNLEHYLGRRLAIDAHYYQWKSTFPRSVDRWDLQNGRTPYMNWAQVASGIINSGSQDSWIRQRAIAVKALGRPVFISFAPEMDRKSTSGGPSAYKAAWYRIRRIFNSVGASNVRWVWCPTNSGFQTGRAQPYYPGSWSVDWVCANGFNWGGSRGGFEWRQFTDIFPAFYNWAVRTGKPIVISEWGSVEGGSGAKAQWFHNLQYQVKSRFPALDALIYFDTVSHTPSVINWRVDTSWSSYSAFKQLANDPYYRAF
jgi:hypothetical protein